MAVNIRNLAPVHWSHFELLQWVNESLQAEFSKIEELCTGAAYCQYMDMLFPGSISMRSVHFRTNNQNEFIKNFKLLTDSFKRLDVHKAIPVENLIMGRFKENFQFVNWFKHFFNANYIGRRYDVVAARQCAVMGYGPSIGINRAKALPVVKRQMLRTRAKTLPKINRPQKVDSHISLRFPEHQYSNFDYDAAYNQLDGCTKILIATKKEHLFYSTKLEKMQNICTRFDVRGDNPLLEDIKEIIQKPAHGFVVLPDQMPPQ